MSKSRYRILAGTALAAVLAVPFVSMATNAVTISAPPSDQMLLEIAHASVAQANAARGPVILAATVEADEVQGNATSVILNTPAPATIAPVSAAVEEPTVAPDPMASLDPADRPIAENIRDLLAVKADKLFANAKEREAVEVFYRDRNFAPMWLDKGIESARAAAVIARLKNADADGLDASDYRIRASRTLDRMHSPRPTFALRASS